MKSRKNLLIGLAAGALAGALVGGFKARLDIPLDKALLAQRQFLAAAVAGWVLFSVYWESVAKGAAEAKSSESKGSRRVHVFLTNISLLLIIAPLAAFGRFLPVSIPIMSAGIAVEGLGLMLAIWSRRHLGRYWSGEISIKFDHQLIRAGPYRRLRHPIYTGLLTMYAGTTMVTGEWLAIFGLTIAVFAYWRKIRLEETNLDVAFGPEYEAYRKKTWALIPGLF